MTKRNNNHRTLAKLTAPQVENVLMRERLFKQLDKAFCRPLVWVSGPGGSGKTTLLSSYLKSRKLKSIWYQLDEDDCDIQSWFSYLRLGARSLDIDDELLPALPPIPPTVWRSYGRQFFRQLYRVLPHPGVIILDGFEIVESVTALRELVEIAANEAPPECVLVIISRHEPLECFGRLQANQQIHHLYRDALKLQPNEALELIGNRLNSLETVNINKWLMLCDGWIAGIILLLEESTKRDPNLAMKITPETITKYFESEIWHRVDSTQQNFLLKSALLPQMELSVTKALTGQERALEFLQTMAEKNYFTAGHGKTVYRYHPLFREFLLAKGQTHWSESQLCKLKGRAANLLEESGQFEHSLKYRIQLAEWAEVDRLMNRHAPSLLSQGRYDSIRNWFKQIPDAALKLWPWLRYWRGMGALLSYPQTARSDFKAASQCFEDKNNAVGLYSCFTQTIMTFRFEGKDVKRLDDYWQVYLKLREQYAFPNDELEAQTLTSAYFIQFMRGVNSKSFLALEDRLATLINSDLQLHTKIQIIDHLINRNSWGGGDRAIAEVAMHALTSWLTAIPTDTFSFFGVLEIVHSWFYVNDEALPDVFDRFDRLSTQTLEMGYTSEHVKLLILAAWLRLCCEQCEEGKRLLALATRKLDPKFKNDNGLYYFTQAYAAWLTEDWDNALRFARISENEFNDLGCRPFMVYPLLARAKIYISQGKRDQALEVSENLKHLLPESVYHHGAFFSHLLNAQIFLAANQKANARDSLKSAFEIGHRFGYLRFPFFARTELAMLCSEALDAGIESNYACTLIRGRQLIPGAQARFLPQWPWVLKVRCFGPLQVLRDGESLRFEHGISKKPLAILKFLVLKSGDKVDKTKIIDALWPDKEGDAAHSAFSTNLNRLRKLIGKSTLLLKGGELSLSREHCWVDLWAFEHHLGRAERANLENDTAAFVHHSEKAIGYYQADLFANDDDEVWLQSSRNSLRKKYLRQITRLAQHWDQYKEWRKAIDCYQQGLEVDALNEGFYRGLMRNYCQLGLKSEIIQTYEWCCHQLRLFGGKTPSSDTVRLYKTSLSE